MIPRNKIMLQVLISYLTCFLLSVGLFLLFKRENLAVETIASKDSLLNTVYFFAIIIIETIILILLLKYFKKINIIKILDVIVSFFALTGIISLFIGNLYFILGVAFLLVLIKELWNNIWYKNIIIFLIVGFFSAYIGYSLGVLPIFVLLMLIAIYDYIAVFKTKHMVFLANKIVNQNTLFVMDYGKSNAKKQIQNPKENNEIKEIEPNKRNKLSLGTGDFALPLIAIMTLFAYNIWLGIGAFILCLIGLELTIYLLFSKKHLALPAIPLQAIAILPAYLIYLILILL